MMSGPRRNGPARAATPSLRPTRLLCPGCFLDGLGFELAEEPAPILLKTLEVTAATIWWDDVAQLALCGCGWRRLPFDTLARGAVPGA